MNDIEKEFVPYKESLELKELGFNKECLKWYTNANNLSDDHIFLQYSEDKEFAYAPTFSQAFRFFREKYQLNGISPTRIYKTNSYQSRIIDWNNWEEIGVIQYNTYEKAELECLRALIKIIKNKK